eukprot:scaffold57132_cov19-Tisochrysis_lutea.AAC.3
MAIRTTPGTAMLVLNRCGDDVLVGCILTLLERGWYPVPCTVIMIGRGVVVPSHKAADDQGSSQGWLNLGQLEGAQVPCSPFFVTIGCKGM